VELLASGWGMAWVCAIALFAGVTHGLTGFGFPVISTPMVALATDVRSAVVVTLLPNVVVNVMSVFSGAGWRESLARHWTMPAVVLVGTAIGAQVVLWAPADPLRLLLAAVIVFYLVQGRLTRLDLSFVKRHPRASGVAFGLAAGFLSGTVNVMLPVLLIYFSILELAPIAMTQVMNACFLVGKLSQAAVFGIAGQFTLYGIALAAPVCASAYIGYAAGRRLAPRIPPQRYRRFIQGVLWVMAAVLVAQAAHGMLARHGLLA
jgi:uncharacterized membrane protein YfcA